jgi:hypothetical protein
MGNTSSDESTKNEEACEPKTQQENNSRETEGLNAQNT